MLFAERLGTGCADSMPLVYLVMIRVAAMPEVGSLTGPCVPPGRTAKRCHNRAGGRRASRRTPGYRVPSIRYAEGVSQGDLASGSSSPSSVIPLLSTPLVRSGSTTMCLREHLPCAHMPRASPVAAHAEPSVSSFRRCDATSSWVFENELGDAPQLQQVCQA
jgi:hypothetical protein